MLCSESNAGLITRRPRRMLDEYSEIPSNQVKTIRAGCIGNVFTIDQPIAIALARSQRWDCDLCLPLPKTRNIYKAEAGEWNALLQQQVRENRAINQRPGLIWRDTYTNAGYVLWATIKKDFEIEPALDTSPSITNLIIHNLEAALGAVPVAGPYVQTSDQLTKPSINQPDQPQLTRVDMHRILTQIEIVYLLTTAPFPIVKLRSLQESGMQYSELGRRRYAVRSPLVETATLDCTLQGSVSHNYRNQFREKIAAALPFLSVMDEPVVHEYNSIVGISHQAMEQNVLSASASQKTMAVRRVRPFVIRRRGS